MSTVWHEEQKPIEPGYYWVKGGNMMRTSIVEIQRNGKTHELGIFSTINTHGGPKPHFLPISQMGKSVVFSSRIPEPV